MLDKMFSKPISQSMQHRPTDSCTEVASDWVTLKMFFPLVVYNPSKDKVAPTIIFILQIA